jgi:hypothetical protein
LYDEGCSFWRIKHTLDDESVKYYNCAMFYNEEKYGLASK